MRSAPKGWMGSGLTSFWIDSLTRIRFECGSVHTNEASINRTFARPCRPSTRAEAQIRQLELMPTPDCPVGLVRPRNDASDQAMEAETHSELAETDTEQLSALELTSDPRLGRGQVPRTISAEVDRRLLRDPLGDVHTARKHGRRHARSA